jgi:hypothetical protein
MSATRITAATLERAKRRFWEEAGSPEKEVAPEIPMSLELSQEFMLRVAGVEMSDEFFGRILGDAAEAMGIEIPPTSPETEEQILTVSSVWWSGFILGVIAGRLVDEGDG